VPAIPSEQAWNCLIQAQNKIESKEKAVFAKLFYLCKQKKLLRKYIEKFLSKDLKEMEKLERLEKEERVKAAETKK
jgi:hypothetical protein